VDFGHLNARDLGGVFSSADDYLRIFTKIDHYLGAEVAKNLHCHFSKIEWSAGGEKRHLTFEDDFYGPYPEPLLEEVYKRGYSPTFICESAGTQTEDAAFMMNFYKSLKD
jgi:deoxyribonuclease-4